MYPRAHEHALPPAREGHFWKVPFSWEPGLPVPPGAGRLRYRPADPEWLREALSIVMASSLDESDAAEVASSSPLAAADALLALAGTDFRYEPGWWIAAERDAEPVGLVLPVAFPDSDRDGRPEATILHLGVLPAHRGNGYVDDLLAAATRVLADIGAWRVFCDTSARNHPMLAAFRRAGFQEHPPWERPIVWPDGPGGAA
jgi:ribosomal protein S18 acetylase RimI-like enzyme